MVTFLIGLSQAGAKSVLKLAQRIVFNFYAGVSGSSVRKWDKVLLANVGDNVRILTRINHNDPGEPPGVVLSAAKSVWLPLSKQKLFDFLRDQTCRSQWDILSSGGSMQELIRLPKGQHEGNCVSILRSVVDHNQTTMLVLQETWIDASGALVVYAPVDLSLMNMVMNGGDSAYIALLPSGFSIVPDGTSSFSGPSGSRVKPEGDGNSSGGCLLTIGFQILVKSQSDTHLSEGSICTVDKLISGIIDKIRASLQ